MTVIPIPYCRALLAYFQSPADLRQCCRALQPSDGGRLEQIYCCRVCIILMTINAKKEMTISENVFSNLLLTFQNRANKNEGKNITYVLFGDRGCGKETVLDSLCNVASSSIEPSHNILSYRSVDVSDDMIQGTTMNAWILHDYAFEQVFNTISESYCTEKIGFVIALDLSREDDCVKSLKVWLNRVISLRKRFPTAQNTPIIVVGCKSDSIVTTDTLIVRKAKEIQGELRAICILSNATLIYTSATKGTNIEKLRRIMVNQMKASDTFSTSIVSSIDTEIEDGIDNCVVIKGLDSAELIRISTGFTCDINQDMLLLQDDFARITKEVLETDEVAACSSIGIDDEDEWLAGLQSFIKQVGATTATSNTTSIATSNLLSSSSSSLSSSSTTTTTAAVGTVIPTPVIASSNSTGDINTNMTTTKPTISKRVTRKNTASAGEEKQDASDFFKSLLKK